MEELKRAEELSRWFEHVKSTLQSGLAVEEVFTLTMLELRVPFHDLGFPCFDTFLANVPDLANVLKDVGSIYQIRAVTPVASVPVGSSQESCLKLGNRVIYFTSDGSHRKGTIKWLGRVDKLMCAGVECSDKNNLAPYTYWRGQRLFSTESPFHSRVFRIHELMLKADFDARPTSKISKALSKAMTKIGIRDAPVHDARVDGGNMTNTANTTSPVNSANLATPAKSITASFDVIYPFSVDYTPDGLKINDLVVWLTDRGQYTGIVQWLGHLSHNSGLIAGIDFQQDIGTCSGVSGKNKLFDCLPNHGMFISVTGLIKYDDFCPPTTPSTNFNKSVTRASWRYKNPNAPKSHTNGVPTNPEIPVADLLGISQWIDGKTTASLPDDRLKTSSPSPVQVPVSNSPSPNSERNISPELLDTDTYIEPCILLPRLDRLIGVPKGIQGRNNSCYIDSALFALFACSDIFDDILLKDDIYETVLGRKLKLILRVHIANQLRRNYYCPADHIDRLRISLGDLDRKYLSSMGDCEEFLHTLLDKVLRLKHFIHYTSGVHDFMHQLLPNSLLTEEYGTIQSLLKNSMWFQGLQFSKVPEPALLLILPRADGKLVQHKRVIPNLTLDLSSMTSPPKSCSLCNNNTLATYECEECSKSISPEVTATCAFCTDCFKTFHANMHRAYHLSSAKPIDWQNPEGMELNLQAIICLVNTNHFIAFVKCGSGKLDPWIQHDSMFEGLTPKVQLVLGLGECLAQLEKNPASVPRDWDSFIPEVQNILSNSHLLIYSPRRRQRNFEQTTAV